MQYAEQYILNLLAIIISQFHRKPYVNFVFLCKDMRGRKLNCWYYSSPQRRYNVNTKDQSFGACYCVLERSHCNPGLSGKDFNQCCYSRKNLANSNRRPPVIKTLMPGSYNTQHSPQGREMQKQISANPLDVVWKSASLRIFFQISLPALPPSPHPQISLFLIPPLQPPVSDDTDFEGSSCKGCWMSKIFCRKPASTQLIT